jgi:hypothetical protein
VLARADASTAAVAKLGEQFEALLAATKAEEARSKEWCDAMMARLAMRVGEGEAREVTAAGPPISLGGLMLSPSPGRAGGELAAVASPAPVQSAAWAVGAWSDEVSVLSPSGGGAATAAAARTIDGGALGGGASAATARTSSPSSLLGASTVTAASFAGDEGGTFLARIAEMQRQPPRSSTDTSSMPESPAKSVIKFSYPDSASLKNAG